MTAKRASGQRRRAEGAKPAGKRRAPVLATERTDRKRRPPAPKESFPIAGIGASAGGLEAFTRLLTPLAPDTGMAFVLVQHLDPAHKSMLPEILARHTRMPVVQVKHGMPVAPDHVFVIPPNASMELSDGSFALAPRARQSREPALPIDCFLRSLADVKKSSAIGVVLSGNASDGTLGLQAIKGEGGITFAQDESSAKFHGMPRAAIASGAVDFVLKPEEIARELTRIARHPHVVLPADLKETTGPHRTEKAQNPEAAALRKIFSLVRNATGVDFSYYRQSTILRRVSRRMAVHNIAGLPAYVRFLQETPAEAVALCEDSLIRVTSFFRDPEAFEYLQNKVFPNVLKKRQPGLPVKVWVAGCATGEEAYSIAIALFESLPSPAIVPIQIFASDLSDSAIGKARAGIFMENALAHVSEERRRRFFVEHDGGWQIAKAIRDVCIFARQNVATDPPFSNLDLLSCRNLLIYLDTLLQKRILPLFHHALKPSGYLMLGTAETVAGFSDLFAPVDKRHKIFSKRETGAMRPLNFPAGQFGSPSGSSLDPRPHRTERERSAGAPDLSRETDSILLARYAPAGVVVNSQMEVVLFRGRTGAYLEAAPGKASLNILQMAREGLLADLRAALHRARSQNARVRKERIRVREDGSYRFVNLEVLPLRATSEAGRLYLVTFEDAAAAEPPAGRTRHPKAAAKRAGRTGKTDRETERLERELSSTKEYLQATIEEQESANEELKSANEEILSSNEELQSTNEELDTAKEELQSTNEELTTLNEELQNRNAEVARAHDDLSNLIASVQLPIVVVGREGNIRRFTPGAGKLFNLIPADIGRPMRDIRANFEAPELPALVAQAIETIQLEEREIRDREGCWHLLRVRPYRTGDNRIDGAVIVLLDIDEAKKGQLEAAEARDFSEAIVETARHAMLVLNPDLTVRTANQSFYRTFGVSPGETEGRLVYDLGNRQWDIPRLRRLLEDIIPQDRVIQDFEVEHDFEGLGPRSMILNARQTTLAAEKTGLILLAIEDITERRFQERQTQSFAAARYRNLLDSTRGGILIADGESGEILDVNRYLTELLGSAREEFLGKKPWQIPFLADSEAMRLAFADLTENGFAYDPDLVLTTNSGETVHMEAVGNAYLSGMKKFVQVNLKDTTARRRLEEELRQSQKLESLGRLAGGVAHDFNNLLNIISSYTEILAHGDGDPKKGENIEAIQTAVQRGAGLVRQLLNFARREQTPVEAVDLNAVLVEVSRVLKETFPKKISVRSELEPALSAIRADHNQLYQAILNLCVNARDAMPDGGTLTLATEKAKLQDVERRFPEAAAQLYACVSVADTGVGMDEETRRQIFEPFFTTKERGSGSGLGLAVVHGVMRSHRGLLDVTSQKGSGTTFRLYFPALAPRETHVTKVADTSLVRGGTETLLFLEDEEMLASSIQSLLEEEGYRVLTAKDGQEGVEIYRERASEIALVIADLEMPRLSGAEAYSKMKELNPEIAALVATGFMDPARERQLTEAGVAGFLRKPYSSSDILKTIRETLDARQARAEPASRRGPGRRRSKRR